MTENQTNQTAHEIVQGTIGKISQLLETDGWEDGTSMGQKGKTFGKEFNRQWHYINIMPCDGNVVQNKYDSQTDLQGQINDALSPIGREMMGLPKKDKPTGADAPAGQEE